MSTTTPAPDRTHDFGPGRRFWGHDYSISRVTDSGQRVQASGWGHDGTLIREGDFLLLEARGGRRCTRYRVESIEHVMDPADMWHAELVFDPRTYATQEEKDAAR
ncbi:MULTISPECIES: hypothetical protein [Streptomyces]|uniref:Uncharacterized protein n=1 Tax=Streptomyces showdoensis TaxID=68268 RepID=A0A2P2GKP7_STREW|nr:hypothetical protein [Streptomyces showdoensis]KKZ72080.1 hypothetical protein VO63_20060 [Streptomyces showdoensis]MCW7991237.1 hypothetical protein [Streptomyces platensis subsp. clarensis]